MLASGRNAFARRSGADDERRRRGRRSDNHTERTRKGESEFVCSTGKHKTRRAKIGPAGFGVTSSFRILSSAFD
jgi:hypothetical protein